MVRLEMSGEGTSQSYQSKAGVSLRCGYRRASLKAANDSGRGILLTLVFMEQIVRWKSKIAEGRREIRTF